jgi:hypothetical protein
MPKFSWGTYQARIIPKGTTLSEAALVEFYYFPMEEFSWVVGIILFLLLVWIYIRVSPRKWVVKILILLTGAVGIILSWIGVDTAIYSLPVQTVALFFIIIISLRFRYLITDIIILLVIAVLIAIANTAYHFGLSPRGTFFSGALEIAWYASLINLCLCLPLIVSRIALRKRYTWVRWLVSLSVGMLFCSSIFFIWRYFDLYQDYWRMALLSLVVQFIAYLPILILLLCSPWLRQVFTGGKQVSKLPAKSV